MDPTVIPTMPTAVPTTAIPTIPTESPTTGIPTTGFPTSSPSTATPTTEVYDAIQAFQTELNSLFCDGLSVGGDRCDGIYGIQDFINSFSDNFEEGTEDVSDVVQAIMDRVDSELNMRADFLTTLIEAVNASCS